MFAVIDGSYFLYRSYHGMAPLQTSGGIPTGAIKGFLNALRKVMFEHEPSHIAIVIDGSSGSSARKAIRPAYKSDRKPMPDELRIQLDYIKQILTLRGFTIVVAETIEGDDALGQLAWYANRLGKDTVVFTGDKDMAQLVTEDSPGIKLINPFTGEYLDSKGVFNKFGVEPYQIPAYLALLGDNADGIAGVNGIGKVKASAILSNYPSVEHLIQHANDIPGDAGNALRSQMDHFIENIRLTTIATEPDITTQFTPLTFINPQLTELPEDQRRELKSVYESLEFRMLAAGVPLD